VQNLKCTRIIPRRGEMPINVQGHEDMQGMLEVVEWPLYSRSRNYQSLVYGLLDGS
jgi:hypothetical protein